MRPNAVRSAGFVGTYWASTTAVAESKHGQMALGRTSCLSMAGNSSDISGISGRTGGALPAPMFSVAGCNLPGTTYGPQYLQRELDRRWLQVPYCDSGHALFCWLAAVEMPHSNVSWSAPKRASHSQPESSEDIRESKILRLCSVLLNTVPPKALGNQAAHASNENVTLEDYVVALPVAEKRKTMIQHEQGSVIFLQNDLNSSCPTLG